MKTCLLVRIPTVGAPGGGGGVCAQSGKARRANANELLIRMTGLLVVDRIAFETNFLFDLLDKIGCRLECCRTTTLHHLFHSDEQFVVGINRRLVGSWRRCR